MYLDPKLYSRGNRSQKMDLFSEGLPVTVLWSVMKGTPHGKSFGPVYTQQYKGIISSNHCVSSVAQLVEWQTSILMVQSSNPSQYFQFFAQPSPFFRDFSPNQIQRIINCAFLLSFAKQGWLWVKSTNQCGQFAYSQVNERC